MTDTTTATTTTAAAITSSADVDRHEVTVMQEHPLPAHNPAHTVFEPRSFGELLQFCDFIAKSELVPKDYQNKPANCAVAIQRGAEVGLRPIQSLWSICVINGRPSMWGDSQIALVRASPLCEYVVETWDDDGTAVCRAKRRGDPFEHIVTFSVADAQKAGLASKQGPHQSFPKRMRQLRARAFCLRDKFADILAGMPQAEEMLFITPEGSSPASLPRNATGAQVAAAAAASAQGERTDAHAKQIADLDHIAFNQGTAKLAEAWQALSKGDRQAIGAEELKRLQTKAAECDAVVQAAAGDAGNRSGDAPDDEAGGAQ